MCVGHYGEHLFSNVPNGLCRHWMSIQIITIKENRMSLVPNLSEDNILDVLQKSEVFTLVLTNNDLVIATCYDDGSEKLLLINPVLIFYHENDQGAQYLFKTYNFTAQDEPVYMDKSKIMYANHLNEEFDQLYKNFLFQKAKKLLKTMLAELYNIPEEEPFIPEHGLDKSKLH